MGSFHLICLVIFLVNLLSWTNTVFFITYVQTVDQQDLISMGGKITAKGKISWNFYFFLIWFDFQSKAVFSPELPFTTDIGTDTFFSSQFIPEISFTFLMLSIPSLTYVLCKNSSLWPFFHVPALAQLHVSQGRCSSFIQQTSDIFIFFPAYVWR